MEGLNWGGIIFFILPIVVAIATLIGMIIFEIFVQATVINRKIRGDIAWERKCKR